MTTAPTTPTAPSAGPFGEIRVLLTPPDYDASRAFWADVVGLEVARTFDDDAGVLLRLGPGTCLELLREAHGAEAGGALRLSVEVADVLEWYTRLSEGGAAVASPADQPWGHRSFTLRDPGGLLVTFFQVLADPPTA